MRSTAAPYTESRLAHLVRNKCVGFPVVEHICMVYLQVQPPIFEYLFYKLLLNQFMFLILYTGHYTSEQPMNIPIKSCSSFFVVDKEIRERSDSKSGKGLAFILYIYEKMREGLFIHEEVVSNI